MFRIGPGILSKVVVTVIGTYTPTLSNVSILFSITFLPYSYAIITRAYDSALILTVATR